ncbi:MAG: hypothetical protein Alpg2KO_33380 [Alphaproteobacteria bacterium]
MRHRIFRSQKGVSATSYALLVGLIGVIAIGTISTIGSNVDQLMTTSAGVMQTASGGGNAGESGSDLSIPAFPTALNPEGSVVSVTVPSGIEDTSVEISVNGDLGISDGQGGPFGSSLTVAPGDSFDLMLPASVPDVQVGGTLSTDSAELGSVQISMTPVGASGSSYQFQGASINRTSSTPYTTPESSFGAAYNNLQAYAQSNSDQMDTDNGPTVYGSLPAPYLLQVNDHGTHTDYIYAHYRPMNATPTAFSSSYGDGCGNILTPPSTGRPAYNSTEAIFYQQNSSYFLLSWGDSINCNIFFGGSYRPEPPAAHQMYNNCTSSPGNFFQGYLCNSSYWPIVSRSPTYVLRVTN